MFCVEDDVQLLAKEIMEYLHQRPMASDSLSGIAFWWVVQQEITKNVVLVEKALEYLIQEGKVKKVNNYCDTIYFLNKTNKP